MTYNVFGGTLNPAQPSTMKCFWLGLLVWCCHQLCLCAIGLLVDMKGLVVTSVALGKAHGVLLTNRGHVFTFGPNNKGQSGRDFTGSGGGQSTKERTLLCLYISSYKMTVILHV